MSGNWASKAVINRVLDFSCGFWSDEARTFGNLMETGENNVPFGLVDSKVELAKCLPAINEGKKVDKCTANQE